jgi:Hint module
LACFSRSIATDRELYTPISSTHRAEPFAAVAEPSLFCSLLPHKTTKRNPAMSTWRQPRPQQEGGHRASAVYAAFLLVALPAVTGAVYLPTCAGSPAERQWNTIYAACKACVNPIHCPSGCCFQRISSRQFYLCAAPGCCLRFIQTSSETSSATAVIVSEGMAQTTAAGLCAPVSSQGSCSSSSCALELQSTGLVTCAGGYNVSAPSQSYASSACIARPASQTTSVTGSETQFTTKQPSADTFSTTKMTTANAAKDPAPSPLPKQTSSCFPANARVRLSSGAYRTMSNLRVGDFVQVGPAMFSEIFMFTHRDAGGVHEFLQISTHDSAVISLSATHYLYVNSALAPAISIALGDSLMLADGRTSTVTKIEKVRARGLYNPQTLQGDIIVEGILASTYTTAVAPKIAHASLYPLRSIYITTGWSTSFFDDGIHGWFRNNRAGLKKCLKPTVIHLR